MTALVWDKLGDRTYELGVSKGVLYKANNFGVAWNGLKSVVEAPPVDSIEPVYFDGQKFNDIITMGDFAATVTAITYPEEFLVCEGTLEEDDGFFLTAQEPTRFGMSYRTEVADDVSGLGPGYKLHLIYNALATPAQRNYETINEDAEPMDFEWNITAIPEQISQRRPTAHVVFDSRKMDPYLLADIEDILYGTETRLPFLPSLRNLTAFVRKWARFIVTDNGDGTWTASSKIEGVIVVHDDGTFEINSPTAVMIDAVTYRLSSDEVNDEDIFIRNSDRLLVRDNGNGTFSVDSPKPGVISVNQDTGIFTINAPEVTMIDDDTYEISAPEEDEWLP